MTNSPDVRIRSLRAWEALDSRGVPTVGCRATLMSGAIGRVVVPSGRSTGSHEVPEIRDGGERYDGKGVRTAVNAVDTLLHEVVRGLEATDSVAVDTALERELVSRPAQVGSNATLAVSVACALAAAAALDQPLWRFLRPDGDPVLPMPMIQLMAGGVHAGGAIDIQDILVLPVAAASFAEAIEHVARVRSSLGRILSQRSQFLGLVGDEGGWAERFPSNRAALETAARAIADAGFGPTEMVIGIDVAANQLMTQDGLFALRSEERVLDHDDWTGELVEWTRHLPLASIEDPLGEDDWDGWTELRGRLPGVQLVGDDLFATDSQRVRRGVAQRVANAVLIKPNQCGTLTSAARALREAKGAGWTVIVSARSGESEDDWLADLAIGWGADQIKVGALVRSERTAKWNRLLEVEADPASNARFRGWSLVNG